MSIVTFTVLADGFALAEVPSSAATLTFVLPPTQEDHAVSEAAGFLDALFSTDGRARGVLTSSPSALDTSYITHIGGGVQAVMNLVVEFTGADDLSEWLESSGLIGEGGAEVNVGPVESPFFDPDAEAIRDARSAALDQAWLAATEWADLTGASSPRIKGVKEISIHALDGADTASHAYHARIKASFTAVI